MLRLNKARVWLKQARLALFPDACAFYTILADDGQLRALELDQPRWLNLGYWKSARNHTQACTALAHFLGETAGLTAEHYLLDAGFGYGDQDLYWLEHFQVRSLVGINVTALQVQTARARAARRGLGSRAEFLVASATAIPFASATFDTVVSLEAAFHFSTREQFFRESFRVLKPGGTLAVADMIPLPGERWQSPGRAVRRRLAAIFDCNMYDRGVYEEKLNSAGFRSARVESIRQFVYPGFAKCLRLSAGHDLDINVPEVQLTEDELSSCAGIELWSERYGISDYVLATARKPVQGLSCASTASN